MTITDKPLAIEGLTSYRYRGRYNYIMIGASNTLCALSEANRSLYSDDAVVSKLEIWNEEQNKYIPV